jgi:hypothetical protein
MPFAVARLYDEERYYTDLPGDSDYAIIVELEAETWEPRLVTTEIAEEPTVFASVYIRAEGESPLGWYFRTISVPVAELDIIEKFPEFGRAYDFAIMNDDQRLRWIAERGESVEQAIDQEIRREVTVRQSEMINYLLVGILVAVIVLAVAVIVFGGK